MYSPHPFKVIDPEVVSDIITKHPLATIVSNDSMFPMASHLPLLEAPEQKGVILGHISRANPHVAILKNNPKVLLIFHGEQGYISSYAKDPENLSILPTWDYQIVHLTGILKFVEQEELIKSLDILMKTNEAGQPKRLDLKDYSRESFTKKIQMIIGFEVKIEDVVGCFRLNQNRTETEREHITEHLIKEGNTKLASEIKELNHK